MKISVLLSLIAVAGVPLMGLAADEKSAKSEAKEPDMDLRGQVTAADSSANTFTCKMSDGTERTLTVSKKTIIAKRGLPADFSAITAGTYAFWELQKGGSNPLEVRSVRIEVSPGKRFGFSGQVFAVDPVKKIFSCSKKNGTKRLLSLVEHTTIQKEGVKADFSAITVGANVAGRCAKVDGIYELDSVRILSKPEESGPDED